MSAPRDDLVYLSHIRDAAVQIASYVHGITRDEFLASALLQDGVIRQMQVIGEAANRLSVDFRAGTSEIPWADIAGMRDKLVHDYMGTDPHAVWDTAVRDVPSLRAFEPSSSSFS